MLVLKSSIGWLQETEAWSRMALFNLKDLSAVNTLFLFLCNIFFSLSEIVFVLEVFFFSGFLWLLSFRDSECLVLLPHLFSAGVGIKVYGDEVVYHLLGLLLPRQ